MTQADRSGVRTAFISATSEDLDEHRRAARDAVIDAGFYPSAMEYFPASGRRPLAECLARVDEADVVVAIVAHRYGWEPPDQSPDEQRSITWLECAHAAASGKEVLAFLVDDKVKWPEEHREEFAILTAIREGQSTPALLADVQRKVERLGQFKAWLGERRVRATFTTPDDLRARVVNALHHWRSDRGRPAPAASAARAGDPGRYLKALYLRTAHIDIRGLQVGRGRAHRFPIEDLYIGLTTTGVGGGAGGGPRRAAGGAKSPRRAGAKSGAATRAEKPGLERPAPSALHEALAHAPLVVIGDPGAGKTTFLRRIACALCKTWLGEDPEAARRDVGIDDRPLPIFVRLAELAEHIARSRGSTSAPAATSAAWLPHYLAAAAKDGDWDLDEAYFRHRLWSGDCLLLLDGLDEAPDRVTRKALASVIENVTVDYGRCRMVVTSRPAAYTGEAVLPGFTHAQIDALDVEAIGRFLGRWCEALFPGEEIQASAHRDELVQALRVPAIARLARNPVMLTALAVVHWNERRLPEQRADLYESILTWLSRSREERAGRQPAERCLVLLQALALAMQNHKEGRKVQVSRRAAAEAIAGEFRAARRGDRVAAAEQFLESEEMDSGIVVGRGSELRFWHLTFQEFLAAKAIGGLPETEQRSLLLGRGGRLYAPEWREVALLLGGVLHGQGRAKVDGLVAGILDDLGKRSTRAAEARCAGLLGALARDLAPRRYEIADARYPELLERVLGIFDAAQSASIPVDVRIEAAEALGQAGDPRLGLDNPERWATIPAGTFLMGAQNGDPAKPNHDDEARDNESPVHEVELDAYTIGRYPVTVSEYAEFVDHGGYEDPRWWESGGHGQFEAPEDWAEQLQFPNRPVVRVSWFEAMAYCAWAGCRLPTEAEWERAARGTSGRKFPWGSEPADPARLNYDGNVGRPTPVGVYPLGATPEGVRDLAGNVWEWCRDWYDAYRESDRRNPQGPANGEARVVRGGSWSFDARDARSAYRDDVHPDDRYSLIGFRVVGRAASGLGSG